MSTEDQRGEPPNKRRKVGKKPILSFKSKMNEIVLKCEWNMCVVTMQKMEKFLFHVAEHVASVNEIPSNEGYLCLWRACCFATQSKAEFDRHVYFHAFHSKIKGIGEIVMKHYELQCTMDDQSRNIIPELPEPFECMWDECRFSFISAQDFYWHVQGHVNTIGKKNNEYFCSWEGCHFKSSVKESVTRHSKSHSQEKSVGCPICGTIFAGVNKFQDHCHRHLAQGLQTFECSHCKCKFATERLLKDHVRRHVNHYKCPHCEMTCTTKATMEAHIKYRHTNNKPFKCPECNKRFKLQYDVVKHLPTHSVEPSYVCVYPDCTYSCRSYTAYRIHMKRVHEVGNLNVYLCHMCDERFPLGFKLTQHLKNIHDYHWPAGHTRFRYSKDEDGYYRLQTTRFESIELAQEILKQAADEDSDDPELQVADEVLENETDSGQDTESLFGTDGMSSPVVREVEIPPNAF
ncbi:UNVERIFIED_CONTAM: hypothetical protein RMT77_006613 [Armadillidium vulgare]